jgi:uncharacterized protein (DUF305 family)
MVVTTLVGTAARAEGQPNQHKAHRTHTIYRLSCRGRRCSQAAKKHNANLRFASIDVALRHHAHSGDMSQIVALTVSQAEYKRLFFRHHPGHRQPVFVPGTDLRHLKSLA